VRDRSYNEQQKQSDADAADNVRPFPMQGNGYFTSENGTDEHGG